MFLKQAFENTTVLCTGGSRGIGRAIVTQFAEAGATVHFFYLQNGSAARAVCDSIETAGGRAQCYPVDVRDPEQCKAAVEAIIRAEQTIDVLVNNSGIVRDNLLVALDAEAIQDVFDTNVKGTFNMCQAVVPHMVRARRGSIVNMSSVSAEKGGQGQTNYAASKGAINAFTKSLAVELAKRKIRVNAVAPGVIETDMSQAVRDLAEQAILDRILLKRFGQPEEVANVVTFLASRYAAYLTGEIIHVDGGFKMA